MVQQRGGGDARVQRAITRGAGGCGPPAVVDEDLEGARGAGTTAHVQIQNFLLTSGVLGEIAIPRGSKRRIANTGCQAPGSSEWYADLVRLGPTVVIGEVRADVLQVLARFDAWVDAAADEPE